MTKGGEQSRAKWWVNSRAWIGILLMVPFAAAALASWPIVKKEDLLLACLLNAVAWVLFVTGVVFRWWATLHVAGRKSKILVAEGPYSVCRNPLYFGTFLITFAIVFYVPSATLAAGLIVASVFYLGVTIPHEEHNLRDLFGETYVRYCEDVPRFLPRLRKPNSPPQIDVLTIGLRKEFFRATRYVWVPVLAQTIAHLRMESWWPHWWMLP